MIKIADIAQINSGFTFRKGQSFDYPENYSLIQVGDLGEQFQLQMEDIDRIIEIEPKIQFVLNPGDVLFASKGEYNFAALIPDDIGKAIASSTFLILKDLDEKIIPEYLVWYINSTEGQKYLKSVRKGNTIPYISKSAFVKMPIILPNIGDQKMIARINALKRKENSLRKQLLEKRKNMIEQQILNHINKKSIR